MHDSATPLVRAKVSVLQAVGVGTRPQELQATTHEDAEEDFCPAYGFLRGIRDRGLAVEFRLRNGTSEFFSYALLGQFRFEPSTGILLRFSGDTITLVLIRGSNLDAPVRQNSINLTDRGLQRHRITFVREMHEQELRQVGEGGPTIDRIEIAEFETQEEVQAWIARHASAFVRKGATG
jgi:hypothetical protein